VKLFGSLAAVAALLAAAPCSAQVHGRVVRVSDGDTVVVLDRDFVQHKIRLAGIDAPEKGQPFGQRARQALAECSAGKNVRVEGTKRDRYERLVGTVWVEGTDCNLRQLQLGMAWHYKKYVGEQSRSEAHAYAATERDARARLLGIWSSRSPEAPWDYRTSVRERGKGRISHD
jgi:endonuclease YncB( thermonuclease family)